MFGVRFRPAMWNLCVPALWSELTDRTAPLGDIAGGAGDSLLRDLGGMSSVREMVAAVLVTLGTNARPDGCIKLTASDDLWRIGVRLYRVIYQILDAELIVTIVKVGDRKDVYR